jgi:hypothetical protein
MDMMTAAFLSIAITTLSVTTITAAVSACARARLGSLTTRSIRARTRPEFRRQATRVARTPHSARLIRPQYLPALARARLLRAQTPYLAITTPRRRQIVPARLSGSVNPAPQASYADRHE